MNNPITMPGSKQVTAKDTQNARAKLISRVNRRGAGSKTGNSAAKRANGDSFNLETSLGSDASTVGINSSAYSQVQTSFEVNLYVNIVGYRFKIINFWFIFYMG